MKRLVSVCVLFALLFSVLTVFSACSEEKPAGTDNETQENSVSEAEANAEAETEPGETGRADVRDKLPEDLDLKGDAFRFIIRPECAYFDATGEDSGDNVYEAVYKRNLSVEERLNAKLNYFLTPTNDLNEIAETIRQSVTAGSDDYDVAMIRGIEAFTQSVQGLYLDLNHSEYVDTSAPWWWMDIVRDCSINTERIYFLTGDISLSTFLFSTACFFNKSMLTDYGLSADELYDTVSEGKWTYDRFFEYCSGIYRDTDGDGTASDEDVYATSWLGWNSNYFVYSAGLKYTNRDPDGFPVLNINTDRSLTLLEKLNHLLHEDNIAYSIPSQNYQELALYFNSRRNLFMMGRLIWATDIYDNNLRTMEDPYGIIPYPKLDESCGYMAGTGVSGNFVAILGTCARAEQAEAVLEAMCAENYRSVFPLFYETMLKVKYSDSNIDSRMIDLIHDSVYVDFTQMANLDILLTSLSVSGDSDFASAYAKNEKILNKNLDKLIGQYRSNP